jgi:hypothetical protein
MANAKPKQNLSLKTNSSKLILFKTKKKPIQPKQWLINFANIRPQK